jgi:hypothetical protein
MSQAVQPYREPEATPVGHSGARVDIHERPAWAINGIVELDEERKAAMVSNLLVVLCADQPASPVVNAGTLYT